MSKMLEVLFISDDSDHQLSCSAWDYRSTTNLMGYKGGGSAQMRTLGFLRSHYVLSADSTKPLIHVWPINSQEQVSSSRFVTPGKTSSLAVSPDGNYLVAGIEGTIYVWHVLTGRMLNTITKHYQKINCIQFTDDGSHFASAGQDGYVFVWNLTLVVAREDSQTPLYNFNDHGLSVTDLYISTGGIRAYMTTVSLDRTCNIYDLSNGAQLISVVFTESLHSVVVSALETSVYVGMADGNIYEFHIDSLPRTKEYHIEKTEGNTFIGHKGAVSCLALSLDGHTLVSGGIDKQVCIWHIRSKQLLKSLSRQGAISNIALRLTSLAVFNPEQKQPQILNNNLARIIDPSGDDDIIEVLLTGQEADEFETSNSTLPYNKFAAAFASSVNDAEDGKLREEIKKLKRINNNLFQLCAKKLLRSKN